MSTFSYKLLPSTTTSSPHSYQQEDYTLQWPDPDTHPHHIHQKAETAISAFQTSRRKSESADSDGVVVFPIIQAGQFNVREEETALWLLFHHLNSKSWQKPSEKTKPLVDLTSGYFGLYEPYQDLVLASDVKTRIVAASPKVRSSPHPSSRLLMFFGLGQWLFWLSGYIGPYSRRVYSLGTEIHTSCEARRACVASISQTKRYEWSSSQ